MSIFSFATNGENQYGHMRVKWQMDRTTLI